MKQPEDMTLAEAIAEFEHLDRYFMRCKDMGQGIGTKETSRFALCADRINELDELAEVWSEYEQAGPATLALAWRTRIDAIKRARSQAQTA